MYINNSSRSPTISRIRENNKIKKKTTTISIISKKCLCQTVGAFKRIRVMMVVSGGEFINSLHILNKIFFVSNPKQLHQIDGVNVIHDLFSN